ncbi:MAG: hypothetical protein K2X32_12790 [Phycisphaerales bacterium]|nr:hypothetical protein [Phycisphaerales bacterium]
MLAQPSPDVRVIVRVGQTVSTGTTTRTVQEVRAIRALGPVSFATLLSTDRGDVIYGSFAHDGVSSVLFSAQHGSTRDAGETLGRIEDHFGISATGFIAYSPLMARRADLEFAAPGMLDSVWRYDPSTDENVLVARRGLRVLADPAGATPPGPAEPLPYSAFGSFVGVTQLGTPFWLSGLSATPAGATGERAVLMGIGTPRTLLRASDTLDTAGQICAIGESGILSFSVSPSATALFALVSTECDGQTAEGLPTKKRLIRRDVMGDNPGPLTQLLSEGDAIVQEVVTPGAGVPAGAGGESILSIGELAIADSLACAGARRWAVAARSDAAPTADSMIISDGVVAYREGQVLGGWTLIDEPVGLTLGQRGDLAFLWRARPDGNAAAPWQWVLFLNGNPITWSGQTVGTAELERVYPKLAIGTRRNDGMVPVYAIARTKEGGQSADALIRIAGFSSPVCCPADIADDQGNPLPGLPGVPNNGVTEGDYNAFFAGFFDALEYCDIADDQGNPLPGMPGVPNNGVTEGDYNCFFTYYFSACN